MTRSPSGGRRSGAPRRTSPAGLADLAAVELRPGRRRVEVPSAPDFPAGLGCDVVETSAAHGRRILDRLPRSGCVLADGNHWLWMVPTGSDVDVTWPSITRYRIGAAVLVPHRGPGSTAARGRGVVHWPDQAAPYTHPILLYLAACGIAGIRPAMAVHHR